MDRRAFLRGLGGILACGVAPAVVGSGVLMPVRRLWKPEALTFAYEEIVIAPAEVVSAAEYAWTEAPVIAEPTLAEIIAATIRARAPQIAANVRVQNVLLNRLRARDFRRPFTGGLTL